MINLKKKIKENIGIPELILLGIIILYVILQANSLNDFKQLPSPLFGGDFYYQLGSVYHVTEGGNILDSSSILGTIPGYLPLYSMIVAPFVMIGMEPMHAIFFVSIILMIAAMIITFILLNKLFNDNYIGIIGTILFVLVLYLPIIKYTVFTLLVMIPLFVLFLYKFYINKTWQTALTLGIIVGLLAISHNIAFIGAIIILSVFALMEIIEIIRNKEHKQIHLKFKEYLYTYIVAGIVSMLFWFRPIFEHKLKIVDNVIAWGSMDFSRSIVKWIFVKNTITNHILNFTNVYTTLITIALLASIAILFFIKNINKQFKFIIIFTSGSLIAIFSYFITEPILKLNFSPGYMNVFYMPLAVILVISMGLKILFNYIQNKNHKAYITIAAVIIVLILSHSISQHFNYIKNDRWIQAGKQPISQQYLEMQKFILANSDVNDIVLSTNELSFALNSLTGRKLMINRRAHQNNPFLNFDERELNAAIILYGNSSEKRIELLKKYDIKYLYYDNYWIYSEYSMSQDQVIPYDPIVIRDTPEAREYLDQYNVKYVLMNTWLDPSMKEEYIPKLDLIYITPENYRSFEKPWNADLDNNLEQIWQYNDGKTNVSVIYKITFEDTK